MTAVEIIDEIRHLAPGEKKQVVQFIRTLDEALSLTGLELTKLAGELAGETDSRKARGLKAEIASGFYGKA